MPKGVYPRRPLVERFEAKVEVASYGCWEWTAKLDIGGYGIFWFDGKNRKAHRIAYELFVGPIPAHLTVDHVCCNRKCVNPEHLRLLPLGDNVRRGVDMHARPLRCPRGHAYTEENTYIQPPRAGRRGGRVCRTCHREKQRAYQAEKRRHGPDSVA